MTFQDLIITPIYIILLSLVAYIIRPYVTNSNDRKYFMLALWAKFAGAIFVGFIYQFYYAGGDTFNYYNAGGWIWNSFFDNPGYAFRLIFGPRDYASDLFQYWSRIWFYKDPNSFVIVRLVGLFGLLTLHTYSSTALFFAMFSFLGLWSLFRTFSKIYPASTRLLATSILFMPSVVFWGSGILKDSVTLGALGLLVSASFNIFKFKGFNFRDIFFFIFAVWVIVSVKVYIAVVFIISLSAWLYYLNIARLKSPLLRAAAAPIIGVLFLGGGYLMLNALVGSESKYALENIAQTAAITSYDIRYGWGARTGEGSGFTIGTLDGSWGSMLLLAPSAINVAIFRPYIWEVRNPLMLLAALESLLLLSLTVYFMTRGLAFIRKSLQDPNLKFCLIFAFAFAFAIGVSTSNFGTLMRYKIPLIPFYMTALVILSRNHEKKRIS